MTVTAIVLAGGRSTRFGDDKLAAELDGASVLAATIAALEPLADAVIVAGPTLPEGLRNAPPVTLVADRDQFEGPLAALADVLGSRAFDGADLGIVVGGDMPRLVPAVLAAMLDVLDQDEAVDAVFLGARVATSDPLPRRQALPLALRLAPAARAAREAVDAGQRSLQAFIDRLAHAELPARRWLALDPEGRTLADIDTRADLDRLNAP